MKFTKVTSTVLAGATLLSILAPTASFAATTATSDNGGTKLPMTDTTDAAISFGNNNDNGNRGYLRLQMVPSTLDFGNHAEYKAEHSSFDATGANLGMTGNNTFASYSQKGDNQTETLTTKDDKLKDVNGTAWTTVVDKQTSNAALTDTAKGEAQTAGDWKLTVSNDGEGLVAGGHKITTANLVLSGTKYGRTTDVYGLTNQSIDDGFTAVDTTNDVANDIAKGDYLDSISLDLGSNVQEKMVAQAKPGKGEGADVFGWNPENIVLALNGADVSTGEYHTGLTWTLNTTI